MALVINAGPASVAIVINAGPASVALVISAGPASAALVISASICKVDGDASVMYGPATSSGWRTGIL